MPSQDGLATSSSAQLGQTKLGSGRLYRPELDVLRFFAFLSVFLHHSLGTHVQQPFLLSLILFFHDLLGLGLPLFFFLSSFLITSLLEMEKERTGRIDLFKFYVRRVLRIWPLYFLFLGSLAILGHWFPIAHLGKWRLLAMVFLATNWYSMKRGMGGTVADPLWSIAVEEQFYVLWPGMAMVLSRRGMRIFCWLLAIGCLGGTYLLARSGSDSLSLWLNSIPQFIFFATGALLALKVGMAEREKSSIKAFAYILLGLVAWVFSTLDSAVMKRDAVVVPYHVTLSYAGIACGCALLLWGFLHLPKVLLPHSLQYLGRISYGLYVFHALVLMSTASFLGHFALAQKIPGASLVIKFLMVVGLASLSHKFIEKPFLKWKSAFELVKTRAN